jgi:hypothetical protein
MKSVMSMAIKVRGQGRRTFFREIPVLESLVDRVHKVVQSSHDLWVRQNQHVSLKRVSSR